jgi:hypothetical protein
MGQAGTSFEIYLKEAGIEDEVKELAEARLRTAGLEQEIELHGMTVEGLAERLKIDATQVRRMLGLEDGEILSDAKRVVDEFIWSRAIARRTGRIAE